MAGSINAKSAIRLLIAIVVLIGLFMAVRRAMQGWDDQVRLAQQRVIELQAKIDASVQPSEQKRLSTLRDQAIARVPSWRNLDGSLLLGGGILYALSLIPAVVVLSEAIACFGMKPPLSQVFVAQIRGHLGKYVPGKAMVVIIRARHLSDYQVPFAVGATSVFIETLLMMGVGAAIAGGALYFLPVPRWMATASIVGGVSASLPTLPFVFQRIVKRLSFANTKRLSAETSPTDAPANSTNDGTDCRITWRLFSAAWLWSTVAWLLLGASFTCLVLAIPGGGENHSLATIYLASTASIALAMVIGFVSLLPGGAGVRELVIATVLAPIAGPSQALLAAIAARIVFLSVELAASLFVGGMFKK